MRTRSIAFGLLTAMAAACSDGGTGPQGPASVAISTPQSTLVADESVQLTWLVKDQQGATLANEPVVFTSSNTATATVTNGGLVTGVRPGNVSITGKAGAATGVVAIVVADRGIGIAAADLPHVFDPYFTTRRTGTGLGLAIAKNIVEALGGVITVRSRPTEGTEVRIDLPAAATLE